MNRYKDRLDSSNLYQWAFENLTEEEQDSLKKFAENLADETEKTVEGLIKTMTSEKGIENVNKNFKEFFTEEGLKRWQGKH